MAINIKYHSDDGGEYKENGYLLQNVLQDTLTSDSNMEDLNSEV